MRSLPFRSVAAVLLVLALACNVAAQEESVPPADGAAPAADAQPDRAKSYADLRDSKSRATKALADRYHKLVGLQAWTDVSGKHSRNARYLDHDPDLKWVRLAIVTGSGASRSARETTVQLAKLNKTSQSRVRQIAALQKKLDELATAENPDGTSNPADAAIAAGGEYGREGERGGYRDGESRDGRAVASAGEGGEPAADRTQWATSYAAFRANFSLAPGGGNRNIDWGELHELRALNDAAIAAATDGSERDDSPAAPQVSSNLPEVRWEAPLTRVGRLKTGGGEVRFRLPALPRPLRVRFLLDERESAEAWSSLPTNEPVQFIGRIEIVNPNVIVVRVRRADPAAGNENDNPLEELVDEVEPVSER